MLEKIIKALKIIQERHKEKDIEFILNSDISGGIIANDPFWETGTYLYQWQTLEELENTLNEILI